MVARYTKHIAASIALVALLLLPQTSFAETEKAERLCQSETVEVTEGLYGLCRSDVIALSPFDTKLEVVQANTSFIFLSGTVNGEPRKVLVRKGGLRSYPLGTDQKIVFSYKGKGNEGALLRIEYHGYVAPADTLSMQDRVAQLRETQANSEQSLVQNTEGVDTETTVSKRLTLKERIAQLRAKRAATKSTNRFVKQAEEKKEGLAHSERIAQLREQSNTGLNNRFVQQTTEEKEELYVPLLKLPEYYYDEEKGCQSMDVREKRRRAYEAFTPVSKIRTWSKTPAQMREMGAIRFDFERMDWTADMPYSNRGNYYWKDYGMRMIGDSLYGGIESIYLRSRNGNTTIVNGGKHPCTSAYNPLILSFQIGIKAIAFDMAGYDLNNGTGNVTAHIRAFDKENNEVYSTKQAVRTKQAEHYFSVKFDAAVHRVTVDYGGSEAQEEIDNLWVRFTKDGLGPQPVVQRKDTPIVPLDNEIVIKPELDTNKTKIKNLSIDHRILPPIYDRYCGGNETQTMRDSSGVYRICLNQRVIHPDTGITIEPLFIRGTYAKVRLHWKDAPSKTVSLFKRRFVRVVNGEGKSVYLLFQSKRSFLGDKAQILVAPEEVKAEAVDTYPNAKIGRTYKFAPQGETFQEQEPCVEKDTELIKKAGLYYVCEGQAAFDQKTGMKMLVTELVPQKAGVKIMWSNGTTKHVSIFSGEYVYVVNEEGEKLRLKYDGIIPYGDRHPDADESGFFQIIYEEDFKARFVWENDEQGLNYPVDEDAPYYYYDKVTQTERTESSQQTVLCDWNHTVEKGMYTVCKEHRVQVEGTTAIVVPYRYTKNVALVRVRKELYADSKRIMMRKNRVYRVKDKNGNTVSVRYLGADPTGVLGEFLFQ